MKISGNTKLAAIQEEFQRQFPYLKLEFYSQPHQQGEKTPEQFRLDPELRVREVFKDYRTGFLSLNEQMKVGTFEQMMFDMFHLSVQVFRKSYGKWLQTWSSDMWSLSEQNHRGKIMGGKPHAS